VLSLPLTEGAELRSLEPWNAAEFAAHIDEARAYMLPWVPFAAKVVDEDTAREHLQTFADRTADNGARIYGIWVDGQLKGGTIFRVWEPVMRMCEVGVWLAPAVTGRGLITRAVTHMIDWAVCVRGMHRVEWQASSANKPSLAVAQRLGMTRDGVLRQAIELDGDRHDVEVWSVLADEWRDRT
jgi:ribosomal-protein-serine acetyltransferase